MKASHLFMFGVGFYAIYDLIYDMIRGLSFDGSYTFWQVITLVIFITLWYSIDNKLNKTYKVTKWNE